jgi:hypothetical protein
LVSAKGTSAKDKRTVFLPRSQRQVSEPARPWESLVFLQALIGLRGRSSALFDLLRTPALLPEVDENVVDRDYPRLPFGAVPVFAGLPDFEDDPRPSGALAARLPAGPSALTAACAFLTLASISSAVS